MGVAVAAHAPEAASAFRLYFNELSDTERLSPPDELRAAVQLVRLRAEFWQSVLNCGDATISERILDVVWYDLDESKHPDPERKAFGRSPRGLIALADALAAADRDGVVAANVLEWIEALSSQDTSLAAWARSCESADAALRTARHEFVAANLGLVVAVARRYDRGRLSFLDMIQEGNAGLIKAVNRFDPARGVRFSTYAVWWIRHAIGRALSDKGREIRLPVHVAERQQTVIRARGRFEMKHGRVPTVPELAKATGLDHNRVEDLLKVEYEKALSVDKNTHQVGSLDVEQLAGAPPKPDKELDAVVFRRGLRQALDKLPPMQLEVVTRRFGLDGANPMTLREVGEMHSLSRERIRQIQESALKTLRREFQRSGLS